MNLYKQYENLKTEGFDFFAVVVFVGRGQVCVCVTDCIVFLGLHLRKQLPKKNDKFRSCSKEV